MKNNYITKIISAILSVITIGIISNHRKYSSCCAVLTDVPSSTSEVLIEKDSLRVLSAKNERVKRGIASTTKILTAICVIENSDVSKRFTITKEMVGIEGSSIYLNEGERPTIEELLYGLMLRSGNDAATALAIATSGSIEEFASLMNDTANRIGARDSNFINPHGLDNDDHYSTAYDLAIITAYALKNPIFAKIVDTEKIDFAGEDGDRGRFFVNKNKLLFKDENYNGVKTGYTKKCGRCLVASRTEGDMQLISVVFNCGPMFERSEELLKYGFKNYRKELLLSSDSSYGNATYYDATEKSFSVSVEKDVYYPLTEMERNSLRYEPYISDDCVSFLNPSVPIGKIDVFIGKELIFSAELFIIINDNR